MERIKEEEKRERMYHYTSLDTFYKIIEGVKDDYFTFHAGSIYTMNDTQEMLLGYNSIMKYLPTIEDNLKVPEEEKITTILKDKTKNKLIMEKFGEWLINDDITNFVVSFSAKPDILPLWALYGGIGTGVCLEFSPYQVKEHYTQKLNETKIDIKHCVYKEADIKKLLLTELEIVYKLFLKSNNGTGRKDSMQKLKYLATICGVIGAFIKHPAFEYEQEIRMNLFRNKDEWKFTETHNGQRSVYVEVPIPIKALTGIIIGPAANINHIKNALIMALRTKGIKVEPIQSKIPFRQY